MRVSVLGRPALVADGVIVPLTSNRAAGILAVLAARAGQDVRSELLADEVWEGALIGDSALRVGVSRLRSACRTSGAPDLIQSVPDGYRLAVTEEDLDAEVMEHALRRAIETQASGDPTSCLDLLETAWSLWRGEPFDGFDHLPSVGAHTLRLAELRWSILERRTEALLTLGEGHRALETIRTLTGLQPLRESAAELEMVTLAHLDRAGEAAAAFQRLAAALESELRASPDARLCRLLDAIAGGVEASELAVSARRETRATTSVDGRQTAKPLPDDVDTVRPRQEWSTMGASSKLIGRDAELRRLASVAASAHSDQRIAVLAGEPGMGKTAMLLEFARRQGASGWHVLIGSCDRTSSVAFYPIFEALGGALVPDPDRAARFEAVLRSEDRAAISTSDHFELRRHATLRSVISLFADLAATAPVLFVVDDAQWLDPLSSALLTHLVSSHAELPMLLVLAHRPDLPEDGGCQHVLRAAIESGRSVSIEISGLSADSMTDLAVDVVRCDGSTREFVDDHARRIAFVARLSGGNPLYARQMLAQLTQLDRTGASSGRRLDDLIPDGLERLCSARLNELPIELRDVVDALCVLGDDADVALATTVLDRDEVAFMRNVRDLASLGIVRYSPVDERVVLHHGIIEHLAYERLDGPARARLHQRAAEALVAREASAQRVAFHLAAARPLVDDAVIAAAASRAGDEALRLGDHSVSSRWYGLSVELASPGSTQLAIANHGLGLGRSAAGRIAEARSAIRDGLAAARGQQCWDLMADLLLALSRNSISPSIPDAVAEAAQIEEVLEQLAEGDRRRGLLLCRVADLLMNIDEQRAASSLDAAARLGDQSSDGSDLRSVIAYLRLRQLDARAADPSSAVRLARDLLERSSPGSPDSVRFARMLAAARFRSGDVDGAIGSLPPATRSTNVDGADVLDTHGRFHDGMLHVAATIARTRMDQADAVSAEATSVDHPDVQMLRLTTRMIHLMSIRREQGRLGELESMLSSALRFSPRRLPRPFLAEARRCAGDLAGAGEHLAAFEAELAEMPCDWAYVSTLAVAAETAVAVGHRPLIAELDDRLAGFASQVVVTCAVLLTHGHIDRYRGLLAGASGDHDTAIELHSHARRRDTASGLTLWAAWAAHGEAVNRLERDARGDRGEALALLREASARASQLGSSRLADSVVDAGRRFAIDVVDALPDQGRVSLRFSATGS